MRQAVCFLSSWGQPQAVAFVQQAPRSGRGYVMPVGEQLFGAAACLAFPHLKSHGRPCDQLKCQDLTTAKYLPTAMPCRHWCEC